MPRVRALTVCVLLLTCSAAVGQISRVSSALTGEVVDPSGAAIGGAKVSLRNDATGATRTAYCTGDGRFSMFELPVGEYRLDVEAPGFAPYEAPLLLSIGQAARMRVQLAPASAKVTVTVSGENAALDVAQPALTATVDKERIEELPVRSRNFLNFVLLAPAVSSAPASAAGSTTSATVMAGTGFSFAGQRPTSNSISLDGVSNDDEFSGSARTELSLETVREFQVVNNGLSAEAGGASSGAINVVTRGGANVHHGDAFLFAENGALDAPPKFRDAPARPDLSRYRVGLSLGGALVRDRTFYYAGFEQEHSRGQIASDISPEAAAAINPVLATLPAMANRSLTTGFFPATRAETEATARLDQQISSRHSLMLRYAFTNNREAGDAFNDTGLFDASSHGSAFIADQALTASLASVLSNSAVNELRGQMATRRAVLRTNETAGPEIDITGVATFGRTFAGNSRRRENQYETSDTLSLLRGRHLIKVGASARRVSESLNQLDGGGGLYTFASVADFAAGNAAFYAQSFGDPRLAFAATPVGGFLQDHWTVSPRLTLDLGVRYDFTQLPPAFNQDTNNFSPRAGFAFMPAAGWLLRGGYGLYFDRYLMAALTRPLQFDGARAYQRVADGAAAAAFFHSLLFGSEAPPAAIAPSIFTAQSRMPASYAQQASFGIKREIARNWSASADLLRVRGVKLSRTVNVNLPPPVVLTAADAASLGVTAPTPQQIGRAVFAGRINPAYDDIWQLAHTAGSTYNGVSLVLDRRMSNEIEFTGSYTLSKTTDDASGFSEQPQNPYDLPAERALSRYDQRHRFVFSGLFDLPIGDEEDKPQGAQDENEGLLTKVFSNIELAPIVTIGSGRPVNPLTGLDSNLAHSYSSRPLGMRRDSLRLPATAALDFRMLKYFPLTEHGKLDVVAEFFNLTNRTNVVAINPFFGSGAQPLPSFAQPTDASESRRVQFSLDFEF